ncbi:DUF5684 domain-containing protein [Microbacterium terricola]|uniref:FHA domain-containing protein n=1 Tax=Microbacterium terricola TaxID=344163 RepID=A0ABM8DVN6_9MICO|nr:DUF5684 domain-containing protein [Microbacterium terricola]UYK39564.1 DUF5684 domain-containing protein [Microbacterium terricola]BDV29701.1 hypothetical protein Microterr_03610 [Microbacterium terricola]
MSTSIDASTIVAVWLTSIVIGVILYVWVALALSAVFAKAGEERWKAWVPVLNTIVLLQLGAFSGWLVLLALIPVAGALALWIVLIVACHRINLSFGFGAGMTVLAALLFPIWASVVGFGPAVWIGTEPAAGPRRGVPRAAAPGASASRTPAASAPPTLPVVIPPRPPMPQPAADVWAPAPSRAGYPAGAVDEDDDLEGIDDPIPGGRRAARVIPDDGPTELADRPDPFAPDPFAPAPHAAPAPSAPEPPAPEPPAPEPPAAAAPAQTWAGYDLGAAGATSDVTAAPTDAPEPIAAVPILRRSTARPADAPPPVSAVPEAEEAEPEVVEPWAPARSRRADPDAFDESSGSVSAIAGAPVAGAPRSAQSSVSALHADPHIPEDGDDDETIVARRRTAAWSLVPPNGPAIAITADVVILGRRPLRDRQHPQAQLVSIDDDTVSKTHARLVLRGDRWYVTDLDSTNGVLFATFMGTDVEAPPGVETEAGEKFLLGDAEVKLVKNEA